jgi:hypothetical protein
MTFGLISPQRAKQLLTRSTGHKRIGSEQGVIMFRRLMVFIIVLLPATAGAMTTTWDEKAHIFRVSYPKIAVQIADGFAFNKKDTSNNFGFFSSGGESGTNIKSESHLFFDQKQGKAIKIVIARLTRGFWRSDFTDKIKNPLDKGEIEGARHKFRYAVMASKSKNGGCLLINRIARLYGARKDILLECFYFLEVASKLGDYSKWEKPNALNEDQRAFLSTFIQNSKKEIQFIEP